MTNGAVNTEVWPMPLPYHGIDRDSTLDADERAFRKLLNMEIACLNFLHLGSRCDPPASICGPHELSGRQWTQGADSVGRLGRPDFGQVGGCLWGEV